MEVLWSIVIVLELALSVNVHASEGVISPVPHQNEICPLWYHYCNTTTHNCTCLPVWLLTCNDHEAFLDSGHILSYDASKKLLSLTVSNSYKSLWRYNLTRPGYVQLPKLISQLNDYMCAPLNRRGYMCRECVEGFGPSMTQTSYTDTCYTCRDTVRGVILYLSLEFVSSTVFYLLILLFQINMTLAPMTSFIMYSQLIVMAFQIASWNDRLLNKILFKEDGVLRSVSKVFLTFYGVLNLEFFRYVVNPFCISSELISIHIALLGYISAFYPFLLIILTWVCVELHDRNVRPLVILFRRCFIQLRREWITKSDVTDVFASFFLLSYTKIIYQTMLVLSNQKIYNFSLISESIYYSYVLSIDVSAVSGGVKYICIFIVALLICFVFNVLPVLLLVLYPFRKFRCVLSKVRLNTIAINHFVEKFHYCYRDGLDGGRDMRSFAGLHLLLRIMIVTVVLLFYNIFRFQLWFLRGITFSITAALIALCKPYKKTYLNALDTTLLLYLSIFCHMLSSNRQGEIRYFVPLMQIMVLLPLGIFITVISIKLISGVYHLWIQKSQQLLTHIRAQVNVADTSQCQRIEPIATYGTLT